MVGGLYIRENPIFVFDAVAIWSETTTPTKNTPYFGLKKFLLQQTMPNEARKSDLLKLLPKSVSVLKESLESENEIIRVGTARYIIDQVIGKPTQRVEGDAQALGESTAAAFIQALRRHAIESAPAPDNFEVVEGTVHILPPGEKFSDFPESE